MSFCVCGAESCTCRDYQTLSLLRPSQNDLHPETVVITKELAMKILCNPCCPCGGTSDKRFCVAQQESSIILISDVISSRDRKRRELERYQEELVKIQRQIASLEFDLRLTNTIISMIESETVLDIREHLLERKDGEKTTPDQDQEE